MATRQSIGGANGTSVGLHDTNPRHGTRIGVVVSRPSLTVKSEGDRHGSRCHIATGAVINGPATEALTVYEVKEVEGHIHVHT